MSSTKTVFHVASSGFFSPTWRKSGEEIFRRYNVAHPRREAVLIDGNAAKVVTMVASGTPPSGFLTFNSADVSGLASKGALLPLSDYLVPPQSINTIKEKLVPAAWRVSAWNGKLWSITQENDGAQLIWNKELFRQAGLSGPPKTPQELVAAAGELTRRGPRGELTQLGLYPFSGWVDDGPAAPWTALYGGQWFDAKKNTFTITDPHNIESFQLLLQISNVQGGEPALTTFMQQFKHGPISGMALGKIAMVYWGEGGPGAMQAASKLTFSNLGYACLPHAPGGYCGELKAGNSFMVLKGAKHPHAMADFAYWEVMNVSEPLLIGEFTPAGGTNLPVLTSDLIPGSPNYVRLLKQVPYVQSWLAMSQSGSYIPPDYTPLANWVNGQLDKTLTSIYERKVDVAAGLQQVQRAVDVRWQEFLKRTPHWHNEA